MINEFQNVVAAKLNTLKQKYCLRFPLLPAQSALSVQSARVGASPPSPDELEFQVS